MCRWLDMVGLEGSVFLVFGLRGLKGAARFGGCFGTRIRLWRLIH